MATKVAAKSGSKSGHKSVNKKRQQKCQQNASTKVSTQSGNKVDHKHVQQHRCIKNNWPANAQVKLLLVCFLLACLLTILLHVFVLLFVVASGRPAGLTPFACSLRRGVCSAASRWPSPYPHIPTKPGEADTARRKTLHQPTGHRARTQKTSGASECTTHASRHPCTRHRNAGQRTNCRYPDICSFLDRSAFHQALYPVLRRRFPRQRSCSDACVSLEISILSRDEFPDLASAGPHARLRPGVEHGTDKL